MCVCVCVCVFVFFFREETEEYTIPEGAGNLPDLLQSAKPPIYDEPGVRVVELNREPDSGLGISIVGGKVGPGGLGLRGIFIRHVLESSPAARLGTLVTGDQILEVSLRVRGVILPHFRMSSVVEGLARRTLATLFHLDLHILEHNKKPYTARTRGVLKPFTVLISEIFKWFYGKT